MEEAEASECQKIDTEIVVGSSHEGLSGHHAEEFGGWGRTKVQVVTFRRFGKAGALKSITKNYVKGRGSSFVPEQNYVANSSV